MRKVSQNEFDLLQKRKGVSVKKKMGAQKKPEPVVEDRKALSGAKQPDKSAPALPDVSVPEPAPAVQPMASMAASMAARDAQLEMVISNNTKVLKEFRQSLVEINKPRKRVPWDAIIKRNATNGLMERVRLVPDES